MEQLTAKVSKESEITRSMEELENSIANIGTSSDMLISKIENILSPPEPQSEQCTKEIPKNICSLASAIDSCAQRILRIRDNLEYAISRVQL